MFRAKAQRSKGAKFEICEFPILYFNLAMPIIASNHHLQFHQDKSLSYSGYQLSEIQTYELSR